MSAVHGLQKRGIRDKIIVSANFLPILTRIGLSEGFLTAFLKDDISESPLGNRLEIGISLTYELYLHKGMDKSLRLIYALFTGKVILDYRP